MSDLKNDLKEVLEYFEDYDVDTTNNVLDLEQLALENELALEELTTLLCNLEDTEVMQQLVEGRMDTFNMWDRSQFNDSYGCIMFDLGYGDEDDDDEDEL